MVEVMADLAEGTCAPDGLKTSRKKTLALGRDTDPGKRGRVRALRYNHIAEGRHNDSCGVNETISVKQKQSDTGGQ